MIKEELGTRVWFETIDKKEAKERADYVLRPISRYHESAKTVLELGVGLGTVLKHFVKKFEVYGLDLSKEALKYARKEISKGKFFHSSMNNFKIDRKFDVIFSVHGCVNELGKFSNWESTFKQVHEHLNNDGLFIFDTSTPKILEHFKKKKETTCKKYFNGKYFIYFGAIVKKNILTWDYKIFEKIGKGKYKLHEDNWNETLYSVEKIKSTLSKRFKILETTLMDERKDVLFVCRKK